MRKAKVRGKDKKKTLHIILYLQQQQINKSLRQQNVWMPTNTHTTQLAAKVARATEKSTAVGGLTKKPRFAKALKKIEWRRNKQKWIQKKKVNKTTTKKACAACKKCLAFRAIYAIEDNKWHRDRTNRLTVETENDKKKGKINAHTRHGKNGFSATPSKQ